MPDSHLAVQRIRFGNSHAQYFTWEVATLLLPGWKGNDTQWSGVKVLLGNGVKVGLVMRCLGPSQQW